MKPQPDSVARRFIATTPGLSATRWLAFALASHPEVFVAHGHFQLDSVVAHNFDQEKEKGDIESLTVGNAAANFYQTHSLTEVFAAYRQLKPEAHAYGNIHSYTLETLMRGVASPEDLEAITVVNVLRHPVCYMDSHSSLVRSAERHPELYQHYLRNVFPSALAQFPELFLIDCSNYREFVAFAVSCLSVCQMAHDFIQTRFRHFRMESLTTDVHALKQFCETLTGLDYSSQRLSSFIQQGPINQHRKRSASTDPWTIYSAWAQWQRDMAFMMIPQTVLDGFEREAYDVGMLRDAGFGREIKRNTTGAVPCLLDRLRSMDEHHQLLDPLTSTGGAEVGLPHVSYGEYNIIELRGKVFGLSRRLGSLNIAGIPSEILRELEARGDCVIANSVEEVKKAILCAKRPNPIAAENGRTGGETDTEEHGQPQIVDEYRGFNIVQLRERIYGLRQSIGPVDLSLENEALSNTYSDQDVIVGTSREGIKARIDTVELSRAVEELNQRLEDTSSRLGVMEHQAAESRKLALQACSDAERAQADIAAIRVSAVDQPPGWFHDWSQEVAKIAEELHQQIQQLAEAMDRITARVDDLSYGPGDPSSPLVIEHYRGFRLVLENGKIRSIPEGTDPTTAMFQTNSPEPELARARIDAYLADQAVLSLKARLAASGLRATLAKWFSKKVPERDH